DGVAQDGGNHIGPPRHRQEDERAPERVAEPEESDRRTPDRDGDDDRPALTAEIGHPPGRDGAYERTHAGGGVQEAERDGPAPEHGAGHGGGGPRGRAEDHGVVGGG